MYPDEQYKNIITKLCAPFPKDVHQPRSDGHGTYIPIAIYLERLNEVAGQHWSHERVSEPIFFECDKLVHTLVRVTVCGRSHHGEGFSKYQVDTTGRIINRHYAIRSATKDAIRDALTFFGMKQDSLGAYKRKDKSNTMQNLSAQQENAERRRCKKCRKDLSTEDITKLNELQIKFDFCIEHIPKHLTKNR